MEVPILSYKDKLFEKKFCKALETIGFVQIINHNLFDESVENLLDFFNFEESIKKNCGGKYFPSRKLAPKEGIEFKGDFIDCNIKDKKWIDDINNYDIKMNELACDLLNILEPYTVENINNYSSTLRLLKYDKFTDDNILCDPHTDSGLLTILWQSDKGLQIKNNQSKIEKLFPLSNDWVDIPFIKNSLIVNIGDTMEILTDGILKATEHRVINFSSLTKNSIPSSLTKNRYSIPYFVEPLCNLELPDPSGVMLPYDKWLENKFKRANFVEYLEKK